MSKKNEFGAALDGAGYAPSIMQRGTCCALCGRSWGAKMDRHEPWGAANREKSKALGLWVTLCHFGCHEGPGSVHADAALARELRKDAQRAAMLRYGWSREEWIRRFGKSELSEDEAARIIPADAGRWFSPSVTARRDSSLVRGSQEQTGHEPSEAGLGRRGATGERAEPWPPDTGRSGAERAGQRRGSGFVVLCDPELPY